MSRSFYPDMVLHICFCGLLLNGVKGFQIPRCGNKAERPADAELDHFISLAMVASCHPISPAVSVPPQPEHIGNNHC